MRRVWIVVTLLVVGISVAMATASAQAAPASEKRHCNPEDTDNWGPNCEPIYRRRLPLPAVGSSGAWTIDQVLTFTYAYVMTGPVAVYSNPADPDWGVAPLRVLERGYVWVRLVDRAIYKGQTWYGTDGGGYVPASLVAIYKPSNFRGILTRPRPAVPFAWVLQHVQASPQPGAEPGANSRLFKRYDLVNIYDQREAGGQIWYRVETDQWLVQTAVAKVEWRERPPEVGPDEKWIEIGLFEQTLAAYEGDRMVYATLVSSGLPQWATVEGLFRIHSKYTFSPMDGREGLPDFYSLEDVPWSMYFFHDYALHGAYWHDGFGWQHSHGCVNLAPLDAKWLYDWTSPYVPQGWGGKAASPAEQGTWVWVHG
jgi:hypothetical protein